MSSSVVELKLIPRETVESILGKDTNRSLRLVEYAFEERANGIVLLPDKISMVFDEETQKRINCMPAALPAQRVCGVKWVSVFPPNSQHGLLNVTGVILLSSLETGYPLAVIDGTYITALRTAAVGATAVRHLSRPDSAVIGFIGAGEQARMHFRLIRLVRSIEKCYVASRRRSSERTFAEELGREYPDVSFVTCGGDYGKAVEAADIIVTAVSCQAPLLRARFIRPGTTYIHVGGCEDEYAVAQKADKIVCDEWESVKHRSQTISRMYHEGLLTDDDIYADLWEVVSGRCPGRETDDEFIYFNSVGLAFVDMMFAYEVYKYCQANGIGKRLLLQGEE